MAAVLAQLMRRTDDRATFMPQAATKNTDGAFAEVIYSPDGDKSRWYAVGLVNWIDSEVPGLKYRTATLNGTCLLARKFRLSGEYTYDLELKSNRLTAGIICAF